MEGEEYGGCFTIENLRSPSPEASTPVIATLKASGSPWSSH